MVRVKRIYEPASAEDGYRVLVDRLWPRGVRKAEAHVDAWLKQLAPSTELRRWFGHDPARWDEFRERYRRELETPEARQALEDLARRAAAGTVTLLYSARDTEHNQAVALEEVLRSIGATGAERRARAGT